MAAPTNREVGSLVATRRTFVTGNKTLYAKWIRTFESSIYVVYSYGPHFPMYIYDPATDQWYGNKDKYSPTTSRHKSQAYPPQVDQWFDTAAMKRIVSRVGLVAAACEVMA